MTVLCTSLTFLVHFTCAQLDLGKQWDQFNVLPLCDIFGFHQTFTDEGWICYDKSLFWVFHPSFMTLFFLFYIITFCLFALDMCHGICMRKFVESSTSRAFLIFGMISVLPNVVFLLHSTGHDITIIVFLCVVISDDLSQLPRNWVFWSLFVLDLSFALNGSLADYPGVFLCHILGISLIGWVGYVQLWLQSVWYCHISDQCNCTSLGSAKWRPLY